MINLNDPQLWILVSFSLFVAVAVIPAVRKAKIQLDDRSHRISRQLREVADLYEETREILKQQEQEVNNISVLINKIKLEAEQEISALEKDKQIELKKIQEQYNDRLLKQVKLIKDQYLNDMKQTVLKDVLKVSQNYINNFLTEQDQTSYSNNIIKNMSFQEDKKNESNHP